MIGSTSSRFGCLITTTERIEQWLKMERFLISSRHRVEWGSSQGTPRRRNKGQPLLLWEKAKDLTMQKHCMFANPSQHLLIPSINIKISNKINTNLIETSRRRLAILTWFQWRTLNYDLFWFKIRCYLQGQLNLWNSHTTQMSNVTFIVE